MWIIHFGKWMGTVACTWYFLSHTLLLARNTFPFGVSAKDKNKAVQITTPLINSAKAIVLAFQRTGKCICSAANVMHPTFFSHEEENRAFEHRGCNSWALVMISNIFRGEGGKRCRSLVSVWRKGNSSITQNLLQSFQCYLVHIFSPCADKISLQ